MSPDFDLSGRVALVTGSTRGLGKAMAMALGRAGAKVAMNFAHDESWARRAEADLRAASLHGAVFRGDVTDEADVSRMCREIGSSLGPIDIVVVNATPMQPLKPIEEYDWAFHQQMLDFFVKSPFLLARATLPHMKSVRRGRIINITSEVFARGVGNFSAYVAAKGAQSGWTRSMATELAPWQVTVNAVAPGWIPVERHEGDSAADKAAYERTIPMGAFGVPSDVGGAVVFLASDAARFITGQTIHVNGGMTVS